MIGATVRAHNDENELVVLGENEGSQGVQEGALFCNTFKMKNSYISICLMKF